MYVGRARNPAEVQDALKLAAEIFLVDVPTEQRLANKEMVTRRTPGFSDENVIVLTCAEHGVIGTIVLVPSTLMRADLAISCSYFTSVCVAPQFQGKGYSKMLMSAALEASYQNGCAIAALIARRSVDEFYTKFSFWGVSAHMAVMLNVDRLRRQAPESVQYTTRRTHVDRTLHYDRLFEGSYGLSFGRSRRSQEHWNYILNRKRGADHQIVEIYEEGKLIGYADRDANIVHEVGLDPSCRNPVGALACACEHVEKGCDVRVEIPPSHNLHASIALIGDVTYRQCLLGGHMVRILSPEFFESPSNEVQPNLPTNLKVDVEDFDREREYSASETLNFLGALDLSNPMTGANGNVAMPFSIPRADQI